MTDDPQLAARRAIQLRKRSIEKEKERMTEEIIEALRAAGHDEEADRVRDKELAAKLDAAGYTEPAAKLKGEEQQAPAPAEPTEGERFIEELRSKQAAQWATPGPDLLDD